MLGYAGAAVALLAAVMLAVLYGMLRASLPRLDGEQRAVGLKATVRITRDDLGVPTIDAANRFDLAYGTGFVHGQDRFFQMDLSRRLAAGELACRDTPQEIHLEEAVLTVHEAGRIGEIGASGGFERRHPKRVALDLHG